MNWHRVYGLTDYAKRQYANIRKKESNAVGAGECVECAQCEDQCPQNIPVIQQLKETAAALG
jgi:predicted aldo/keto reductase-like oxidoreductase